MCDMVTIKRTFGGRILLTLFRFRKTAVPPPDTGGGARGAPHPRNSQAVNDL
jgi:hypothetical protein